ncbi:hypothetical protein [Undibacterium sp. RuTC16W]|uniref:hypothetical protein n=1 Tax=Undibacterium sp. RuTC16W TaxID=3413048 RepID=UPI003BEFE0A7
MKSLEERVQMCEQENARLRKQLSWQNKFLLVSFLLAIGGGAIAGGSLKQEVFESIKAKEIIVVDSMGSVRARLGGDLPDAIMADGRVAKRGSKASGLILYDEQGIERGGYVTQDEGSNAMLTLDSKYSQVALFVAGPDESQASALKLWTKGSAIELRSDHNGSRLSISDQQGVKFQQPEVGLSSDNCAEYKKIEKPSLAKQYCQGRFTERACIACLGF